eukprot:TRINITY_DN44509_c0_g2_i2.p1 TRINITY_DN44509_c0_g2~~TRINITY_DN44509_c0_g2_i2.p1  ORF type:complete len:161 (+),score=23.03 TRINITY_DN44509_c0_g2_i2:1-483(+)
MCIRDSHEVEVRVADNFLPPHQQETAINDVASAPSSAFTLLPPAFKKLNDLIDEFSDFPEQYNDLEDLRLQGNVSDNTIAYFMKFSPKLKAFSLTTGQGIVAPERAISSSSITALTFTAIGNTTDNSSVPLTDVALKQIMRNCPNLVSLEVSKCREVRFQ